MAISGSAWLEDYCAEVRRLAKRGNGWVELAAYRSESRRYWVYEHCRLWFRTQVGGPIYFNNGSDRFFRRMLDRFAQRLWFRTVPTWKVKAEVLTPALKLLYQDFEKFWELVEKSKNAKEFAMFLALTK